MLTKDNTILLQNISKLRLLHECNETANLKQEWQFWLLRCTDLYLKDREQFKELFKHELMPFGFMLRYLKYPYGPDHLFGNDPEMLNIFAAKMFKDRKIFAWYAFNESNGHNTLHSIDEWSFYLSIQIKHHNPSLGMQTQLANAFASVMSEVEFDPTVQTGEYVKSHTEIYNVLGIDDINVISLSGFKSGLRILERCKSQYTSHNRWYRLGSNPDEYSVQLRDKSIAKISQTEFRARELCMQFLNSMTDVNIADLEGNTITYTLLTHQFCITNDPDPFYDRLKTILIAKHADFANKNAAGRMAIEILLGWNGDHSSKTLTDALDNCCVLTEKQAEDLLLLSLNHKQYHFSLIFRLLISKIKAINPEWDNWLLDNGLGKNILNIRCPISNIFIYLVALKKPFSELFAKLRDANNTKLLGSCLSAALQPENYPPEIKAFNDVWQYLATNPEVCKEYTDCFAQAKSPCRDFDSVFEKAAKIHNMHFFILIFKKFFAIFAADTKQKTCDAIRNINAQEKDFQPLIDYLEQYSKTKWGPSYRKGLYQDLKARFNPPPLQEKTKSQAKYAMS